MRSKQKLRRKDRAGSRAMMAMLVALAALAALAGCRGGGDAAPRASSVPRSAGDVWVLDSVTDRSTAPAAMLAYSNGLHVIVVDGADVYAGMTRLRATRSGDGSWELRLPGELEARLAPAGDAMELAFSTGERIGMYRRQATREER
jgi:hypothetical protein